MSDETKKVTAPMGEIIPLDELDVVDVSDKAVERRARAFIMGSQAIGRRKDVQAKLEDKVVKRIGRKGKWLTDKLFELIEGVYIMEKKDGKTIRYYQVPPSLQAIVYALDRVIGKPKQTIDHTEEKRGIVLVEHVIKNLAANPYRTNERSNERGEEQPAVRDDEGAGQ